MTANTLASFPYLSYDEFVECIRRFAERHAVHTSTAGTASSIGSAEIAQGSGKEVYLRITRALYSSTKNTSEVQDVDKSPSLLDSDEIEDPDPAIGGHLEEQPDERQVVSGRVEYHAIYSRSWRVPILYLRLHSSSSSLTDEVIMDTAQVSQMLVDDCCVREAIGAVEFGGALGIQDHPVFGVPFMYLHPCNTATLLQAVASAKEDIRVGKSEYAASWLSLVGPAVGLFLPSTPQ